MKILILAVSILAAGPGTLRAAETHIEHDGTHHQEQPEIHEMHECDGHHETYAANWLKELDPALSVFIDTLYYNENSDEGMEHLREEMPGFGHGHEEDDHGHGLDEGFNLREVEVQISGEVDEYFVASATVAFTEDDVEIESAEIETTSLPWNLTIKAGQFFSDFGIINAQHSHSWDFADRPLFYELVFGEHGLNDIGVQASWHAPVPFYLHTGIEALEGDNDKLFSSQDDDNLPDNDGPQLGVAWIKGGPELDPNQTLQFGLFGGKGSHQEIHEETLTENNFLDGDAYFFGGDLLYHYDAGREHGHGDLTFQAEYMLLRKDLNLEASTEPAAPLGQDLDSRQDGYYIQTVYGLFPRWNVGLRWDQIGLTNRVKEPGEPRESFDDSYRTSLMLDFNPSSSSVIRFQLNNGKYATEEGTERVWEGFVQLVVSLGKHHNHSDHHSCRGRH